MNDSYVVDVAINVVRHDDSPIAILKNILSTKTKTKTKTKNKNKKGKQNKATDSWSVR